MTGECHHSGSDAGYTILELLVALAVIAAAAAIAMPRAWVVSEIAELRAAASELAAAARTARAEAVRTGIERVLVVDARRRRFESAGVARALPTRLSLTVAAPKAEGGDGGEHRFRFFGDGSASGGAVGLTSGARGARIEIDWLTGGVRVVISP